MSNTRERKDLAILALKIVSEEAGAGKYYWYNNLVPQAIFHDVCSGLKISPVFKIGYITYGDPYEHYGEGSSAKYASWVEIDGMIFVNIAQDDDICELISYVGLDKECYWTRHLEDFIVEDPDQPETDRAATLKSRHIKRLQHAKGPIEGSTFFQESCRIPTPKEKELYHRVVQRVNSILKSRQDALVIGRNLAPISDYELIHISKSRWGRKGDILLIGKTSEMVLIEEHGKVWSGGFLTTKQESDHTETEVEKELIFYTRSSVLKATRSKKVINLTQRKNALKIWRAWTRTITDPAFLICRRRLMSEFSEMNT